VDVVFVDLMVVLVLVVPIVVDHELFFDVRIQATPEMPGPGLDRNSKPLETMESYSMMN
jgi:hypothetical protein